MHRWLMSALFILLSIGPGCTDRRPGVDVEQGDVDEPPRWHFERVEHALGDMTLTDVYGRDDGTVVVVGWYGAIFTNRTTEQNPEGQWRPMASGTTEHLNGIYGVTNGRQFNQAEARDGEMFAVGWNGTLLHFHPNPDNLPAPQPENGRWRVIGGPGNGFTARVKIDPFCPDYDGDGVLDDAGGDPTTGGPDGWWSPADACAGGATANCDDNCRTSPNGPERPIVDRDGDFGDPVNPANCLEASADGGDAANNQVDGDGDGVGTVCDDNLGQSAINEFRPTLFDVWAAEHPSDNTQVVVVAVGENGALLSYVGPNGAQAVVTPVLPIDDRDAWIAQEQIPFWYTNDCPFLGVAPAYDGTCAGSGRLSPRCPAQCNVLKDGDAYGGASDCDCPVSAGQCCVDGAATPATTGAPCAGPGCVSALGDRTGQPAVNACGGIDGTSPVAGECYDGCPNCFRRLDKTLRAITSDGSTLVAVGASATVIYLNDITNPTAVWTHPHCGADTPAPLDERPILTAVSTDGGTFEAVGAAGTVVVITPSGGCDQTPRCGAPPAFLSGVFSRGNGQAWAVGDGGTFVDLQSASTDCLNDPPVVEIDNDLDGNLNAIWVYTWERMWFVGATGTLIRAGFYSGGAPDTP